MTSNKWYQRQSQGYDHLHTVPRDETSVKVLFYKGIHYQPEIKSKSEKHSDTPHAVRSIESIPIKTRKDPNFKDLTGKKFGDFTVIGLYDCNAFNKWVVRCCCGSYEIRRTTALNKCLKGRENLDRLCCQSCLDLQRLKHKDFFKRHGNYPWKINQEKES